MKTRLKYFLLLPVLTTVLSLLPAGAAEVADLSLSVSILYLQGSTNDYDLPHLVTVSNAGPAVATSVVISNRISTNAIYVSVTGGATPTNGVLLVPLGSLAAGATNSILIAERVTDNPNMAHAVIVENISLVSADQTDPNLANNSLDVLTGFNTTTYTASTVTHETNVTATVNQRVDEYSTELIAKLPNGTVGYDQTFNAEYSDPTVQAAVLQAATALAQAGATSYTEPTPSSLASSTLVGNSSVTVTNVLGRDVSFDTTLYIGPQWTFVGADQSKSFFVLPGCQIYDTLVTTVVTNLVTTTNTATYLNSAVYVMTGLWGPEFRITSIRPIGSGQIELQWGCPTNGFYTIEKSTNLAASSFVPLATVNAVAGPNTNTDTIGSVPRAFYRVAQGALTNAASAATTH
jgi:hypothetical protein